jgi:HEAT repeat protein
MEKYIMADKNVIEKIKNKEWDAVQDAKSIEGEPDEAIIEQASDPDVEVRELAIFCLNEIGGDKAIETFVRSLKDSEEDIRSRAVKFLHEHHSEKVLPELLIQLEENQDYYVREQVALIIGKIDDPSAIPELQKCYDKELDEIIKKNISLAKARLKDEDSQEPILENLKNEDIKILNQALIDFEYINDKELVDNIFPLLDDQRDVRNVAPIGHNYFIRVCDVSINVLDCVLEQPFDFKAGELKRYSDEELMQAKSVLEKNK